MPLSLSRGKPLLVQETTRNILNRMENAIIILSIPKPDTLPQLVRCLPPLSQKMTWMPMPFPRQFFVLGSEKGIVLLDSLNDVEGLIVDI